MIWENLFNDKGRDISSSIIQEITELAVATGAISFGAGEPSLELYPLEELKAALVEVLEGSPEILSYSSPLGDENLRLWLSEWMFRKGYVSERIDPENIILTNGSQEALNLFSELFLCRGRKLLVEQPSYPDGLLAFLKEGVDLVPVKMDSEGPDPEDLEKQVKRTGARFFYTIPTFQNPSGICASLKRKKMIAELAREYDLLIIEDDPYRELWFHQQPPGTYLSVMPGEDRVIYIGSFSKTLAPGLRCGFMIMPGQLREKVSLLRVAMELGPPVILQKAVATFLKGGFFEEHLSGIRYEYRKKRDLIIEALRSEMEPEEIQFQIPQGGFFIWGRLNNVDVDLFARFAARAGKVAFVPGSPFFVEPEKGRSFLRLAFPQISRETAFEGVRALHQALRSFQKANHRC